MCLQGNDKKFLTGLVNDNMHLKLVFSDPRIILLLKSGFSVIFFPSRRQSARRFVRGSDCRQKVEYFSSRALNIVLNVFSLSTNLALAILADSSFADHTVEVPCDSAAGQPLPSDLQCREPMEV